MSGVEIGGGLSPVPDEEYFVYGKRQDSVLLRHELKQIQIFCICFVGTSIEQVTSAILLV